MPDEPAAEPSLDEDGFEAAYEAVRRRVRRERQERRRQDQQWRNHVTALRTSHTRHLADAERRSEELQAALAALERSVRSILTSRRWKISAQIGGLRDRLRRRKAAMAAESNLVEALQRAVALTAASEQRPVPGAADATPSVPEPPESPPGGDPAGVRAYFSDLDGYLRTALTDPLLPAPYDEPALRVLGVMDSLRRSILIAAGPVSPEQPGDLVSVLLSIESASPEAERAIESVLAQSHPRWELLLVGAGAVDAAARWQAQDDRIRPIPVDQPDEAVRDPNDARNHGLAQASGRYVAYLDAHTTWHPDLLRVMLHELRQRPDAGLAYAAQELIGSADGATSQLIGLRFGPYHRSLLENRGVIGLSTVVHRRELLADRPRVFEPELGPLAPWDLLLDLTARTGVLAVPCLLSTTDVTGSDPRIELVGHGDLLSRSVEPVGADPALVRLDQRHQGGALEIEGLAQVVDPHTPPPRGLPDALRRSGIARPTTVVIPSYQAPEHLDACLHALRSFSPAEYVSVTIVDNASDQATWQVIDRHRSDLALEVIANEQNLGFTFAVNQGIDAAGDRDVVLLNNDAVVTPGWIEGLWAALDDVPRTGLVVPRQVVAPGGQPARGHVPCADIDREIDTNLSLLQGNVEPPDPSLPTGYHALTFAPFFCVYVPRATIDRIGTLNVEHGPHYRSDRLYCEAVRHGTDLRVIYTAASKVYHFRRQATKTLRERDPALFEAMCLDNDWATIRAVERA